MKLKLELKSRLRSVSFELIDDDAWKEFFYQGKIYEPEVVSTMLQFIREGDQVVDAGSNLGFFTLLMSKLVGDSGKVFSIEPDERFFCRLEENTALNAMTNVCSQPILLWSSDEERRDFNLTKMGGYSSVLPFNEGMVATRSIMAKRLDGLVSPPVRLIKIDCEGSEEQILFGAEDLLRSGVDCVIVELNSHLMPHIGASEESIRTFMARLGYDPFILAADGQPPMYLEPGHLLVDTTKDEVQLFNIMFSTREKVKDAWRLTTASS